MEMILMMMIVLAAASYLISKVWRGLQGDTTCNCGNCSGGCNKISSESSCSGSVKAK